MAATNVTAISAESLITRASRILTEHGPERAVRFLENAIAHPARTGGQ
jgi:hypothetical protein